MRYAKRVDANQQAILSALRSAGAYCYIIGLPVDILCGYHGKIYLMEIKTDSKKRLTKLQADFFANWTGGSLYRIETPEEALKTIGAIK